MQITLSQFEQIDGMRSAMLAAERGLPTSIAPSPAFCGPNAISIARYESRLFDALIDLLGYHAASEIPSIGEYADTLITDCLIGKVEVLDEAA